LTTYDSDRLGLLSQRQSTIALGLIGNHHEFLPESKTEGCPMATYNLDTQTFTLVTDELSFVLPEIWEGAPTPANSGILGNALNNTLTGDATNNKLEGGLGNDMLIGGGGADTFDGGEGFDIVSYETADVGVTVNLDPSPAIINEAGNDTFISIEGIIGSAFDDMLRGLETNGDLLNGGAGKDTISGGGGNDTIIGGAGADTLWGGDGIDTLSYISAAAAVNVTLNSADESVNGFGIAGDASGDNINGFENLFGSSYNDTLNGNTGANSISGGAGNDILVGKAGNDTLVGGTGADDMQGLEDNDTYYVDNAGDYVRERTGYGRDTIITSISYSLTVEEVEVLKATAGTAALKLTGNSLANTIVGNDGANVLNGKTGADQMQGGKGNDVYYVDNTWDRVVENASSGTDLVYTTISHTLAANVENLTATGTAAVTLTGNTLSNTLTGNGGRNTLKGGAGNDKLNGGWGSDILAGGTGRDVFVFNTRPDRWGNLDTITDFSAVDDTIWLDNAIFTKLGAGTSAAPVTLNSAFLTFGTKAKDANDFLIYDQATGNLSYDADGSGAGAAVVFAKLANRPALTHWDFQVI
jgi:Ca2+-binding RTX toxin-like protein